MKFKQPIPARETETNAIERESKRFKRPLHHCLLAGMPGTFQLLKFKDPV